MCICTTPDASVTLYYTHNRALLAHDTSLHKKENDAEQYHTTVPEYGAPDISYKRNLLMSHSPQEKRQENIEIHQLNRKLTEM